MNSTTFQKITLRHPYLFALGLLVIALGVNFYLQPNLFEQRVLSGNLLPADKLADHNLVEVVLG